MRHLLVLTALGLAATLTAAIPTEAIDELIATELPASGAPGLAYAVAAEGEVAAQDADGVARAGTETAVTPDTPFVIGSISKSFTALAVMQLVEAGLVDLDAPGGDYVAALAGRPAGTPTVRDLLSHTSGFSTLQGNTGRGVGSSASDALERQVDRLADVEPAYAPGTRWEYSNANYQVLGRLIEEVAGTSFQAYLAEHVLEPVGMQDSFVADGQVHPEMAAGHTPWFWTVRPLPETATDRVTAPQGGVVASAHDVALYLAMMMNGEDDVLSAAGKAEMMRPASAASPYYGLGWFLDPSQGTVWHSGATPGIETLATMVPARQEATVVLVNRGSGVGFGETTELRTGITELALGVDFEDEGSRWTQKALFLGLALAPLVYAASMVWAWRRREAVRAKSSAGFAGLFSLWFPLLTTGVGAWVIVSLVPSLMGVGLSTLRVFQPDMALAMIATAVSGVVWAAFRLVIAYTGRARRVVPA